jgi:hypothetical protein
VPTNSAVRRWGELSQASSLLACGLRVKHPREKKLLHRRDFETKSERGELDLGAMMLIDQVSV